MNIEQLRTLEKLADDKASALCFDPEGNAIPELNWHDQFLVEFARLVAENECEACARTASDLATFGHDGHRIAKAIRARGEVK